MAIQMTSDQARAASAAIRENVQVYRSSFASANAAMGELTMTGLVGSGGRAAAMKFEELNTRVDKTSLEAEERAAGLEEMANIMDGIQADAASRTQNL